MTSEPWYVLDATVDTAPFGDQSVWNRFLGVLAATVPVTEFMAPENLEHILTRS